MQESLHTPPLSLYDAAGAELARNIAKCVLGRTERVGEQFQRPVSLTVTGPDSIVPGQILVLSNRENGEVACAFTAESIRQSEVGGMQLIEGQMTVGQISPGLARTQMMDPTTLQDDDD